MHKSQHHELSNDDGDEEEDLGSQAHREMLEKYGRDVGSYETKLSNGAISINGVQFMNRLAELLELDRESSTPLDRTLTAFRFGVEQVDGQWCINVYMPGLVALEEEGTWQLKHANQLDDQLLFRIKVEQLHDRPVILGE